LQAAAAIFYANYFGISLSSDFGGPEFVEATWLSLIGVLVLALGMRLALLGRNATVAIQAEQESVLLEPVPIFILYLIAFALYLFVDRIAFSVPAYTQPLLAAGTLRWVFVFLLAYSVLTQRRHFALLGTVVAFELVTGVLSYFSGFKSIFFILLVVLPSARFVVKGWRLAQFCAATVLMVSLCMIWTVIKADYREFLNQGTGQQEELVPVKQRMERLGELVSGINLAQVEEGLGRLILRVSYVKFFALTIENVPANIPYENGTLWLGTVNHVLMPRFLFPNKPAIHDSERTRYYTGIKVAGPEEGTSIGIGYMAESYVDFGPVG